MPQTSLADYYRDHHDAGGRRGVTVLPEIRGQLFRGWVGAGRRVLDLGCRDGTLTRLFGAGNRVVGADIDDRALADCRQRYATPTVKVNVHSGLPFRAGALDVVVMAEVLEHLPYLRPTLGEVRRVLAPGGEFIGSVPLDLCLKGRWRILRGRRLCHDPTHLQHWSWQTFAEDVAEHFAVHEIVPLRGRARPLWLARLTARQIAFRLGPRAA